MLVRLNRPDLIQYIQSRFDARETGQRASLELDDTIKLVLDVDNMTKYPDLVSATNLNIGSTGWFGSAGTLGVPDGERWRVRSLYFVKNSGTFTITKFGVFDGTSNMPVVIFAADEYAFPFGNLWLESGWALRVYCATWAVVGNVTIMSLIEREESY
jgi:hypothetical protein